MPKALRWVHCLFILGLGLICSVAPTIAQSPTWPAKAVTLVVPFAPGGSTDVTARMLASKLKGEIGENVVVENKSGAGGNVGAEHVARSAPDGYTIFLGTSTHATNATLYKNLSYSLQRDLMPVAQVAFIPNLLVVRPAIPAGTLEEFLAYVRDPKNTVRYGSAGNGSSLHIAGALFNKMAAAHMEHIPYRGSGPAITDRLGGHIEAMFSPLVDVLPHVQSGKLKAIGITTKKRNATLPDVPAIGEALPGYEVALWNGIFVPADTPSDVVIKLNAAINRVLAASDTKKLLAEQGSEPALGTPEQFRDFVAAEVETWRKLVLISGATVVGQ